MTNFKIIGSTNPEIGKEEFYTIDYGQNSILSLPKQNELSNSNPFEEQVHWSIQVLRYGKWYPRKKNNKTGKKVSYIFRQISLNKEKIRITAQMGEQKTILEVKPHPTAERKLLSVDLCDALGNKQTKPFGYNQTVMARVHCLNLDYCTVHITLWEDDAPGKGHSSVNKKNKVTTLPAIVRYGMAEVKFRLSPDFANIANAQLAKRDNDEGKTHEYYVTAEIFRQESKSSNTINVINPDHKDSKETPAKPTVTKKPFPAESKGESKKDNKGIAKPSEDKIYDWWEKSFNVIPMILSDPVEYVNSLMKVNVGDSIWNQKKGTCACKENNFYWSNKLTCDERKKVLEVCANLWGESSKKDKASELMAIMHLETMNTFSPSKKGVSTGGTKYIGLIQFSATTARSIGTTYEALSKMTFIQQMDYVEKYLKQNKDKMKTLVDFYLQVLKPGDVGKGDQPDHAVFDESINVPDGDGSRTAKEQRFENITKEPWATKYGYASNPTFMQGDEHTKRKKWVYTRQQFEDRWGYDNGKTTIKEIDDVLRKEHYTPGGIELFKDQCKNVKEEKPENMNEERAPWMKIAIDIAKEMKGCTEDKEPMYSNAKKFLKYCNNNFEPTDGDNGPWCAAFMNWSIGQTSNTQTKLPFKHSPSAASLAPIDSKEGLNYKKIEEPIYGCIVVYKHITKWKGHTGFLYGKTKKGDYILIGGNQDDTIKFDSYGEFTSKSKKKKFYGFYLPIDYDPTNVDELTENDIYDSAETVNTAFEIITKKTNGKTN